MRLFIACELPEELTEALATTSAELRECVRGRYCAPDTFHVTLAFLGEVPATRVEEIAQLMEGALAGTPAFTATLAELGHFGKSADATLWQGFADPSPFRRLSTAVRGALASADVPFESQTFRPHVTLMRRANLARAGQLPVPCVERGLVSRVTLFSSVLSPDGPTYTPLATVELA